MEDLSTTCEWRGWRSVNASLGHWRASGTRNSDIILQLGRRLLREYAARLGNDVWDVYEQVCVAALDCGDLETAKWCQMKLRDQFSSSTRVLKLQGMILEANGKYEEALQLYKRAMDDTPTSAVLWKRKVAVLKAKGDTKDAISELNALLNVFMSDQEAWTELADLYLASNNYEKAAFCLEELLLSNPHHHLHHQRYAEVCYSLKTVETMEVARKHFAVAVKLNQNNMRALYGFFMVSHSLSCHPKVNRDAKTQNSRYCDWARAQIRNKYMQFDTEKLQVVERMLEKM